MLMPNWMASRMLGLLGRVWLLDQRLAAPPVQGLEAKLYKKGRVCLDLPQNISRVSVN